MSVVDVKTKTVTVKLVYFGCALCGKTTNLQTLHELTDPDNRHGMVSIATKDDRTLFFDLMPMDLGQIGGLTVKVKLYTVPGQVHYELTRRRVLGDQRPPGPNDDRPGQVGPTPRGSCREADSRRHAGATTRVHGTH